MKSQDARDRRWEPKIPTDGPEQDPWSLHPHFSHGTCPLRHSHRDPQEGASEISTVTPLNRSLTLEKCALNLRPVSVPESPIDLNSDLQRPSGVPLGTPGHSYSMTKIQPPKLPEFVPEPSQKPSCGGLKYTFRVTWE